MEADGLAVIRSACVATLCLGIIHGSPAEAARSHKLDLPPGRLSAVIGALAQQAGASVSVDDATLWNRPVRGLKGTFSVRAALRKLLGDAVEIVQVGPDGWRVHPASVHVTRRHPKIPPAATLPPQSDAEAADIFVTASKRDLRLRDYAGSVSIISGSDLSFGGNGGTDGIVSRSATVSSAYLGAGRNKLFIRGIADSSFTGPTQATVGQYLGDVRLTYNAPDPDLRLYDIQSVEVLEGPQATLYGAGSLGGLVRTIPNAPVLGSASGSIVAGVAATQHGAPGGDLAMTLNVPLETDRVALRLVGYGISEGGYIDNPLLGRRDINRTNVSGGRATMRVALGTDWFVDLGGTHQQVHGADSQYADAAGSRLERDSPVTEGFSSAYTLGQIVLSQDVGRVRCRTTTAFIGQSLNERYDATRPNSAPQIFRQRNHTDLITSEIRLWQPLENRFGWVVGASIVDNRTRLDRALGNVDTPALVTGVKNGVTELTLYGEASYRLLPWLTASAGGRSTWTVLSGQAIDQPAALTVAERVLQAAIVADRHETSMLPSVALVATPLSAITFYARYQQGFRPGGLAIDSLFVRRFRGDRVATVEGGIRYRSSGSNPFDASFGLSHTAWRDIQADFLDGSGLPTTDNIGNGRIWSFAASAGWRPFPDLRIDAALAFNDGRVTDPSVAYRALLARAASVSSELDRIPNVARFTVRAGIDWQRELNDGWSLRVGAWGRYVGRSRIGVGPILGGEQGNYADSAVTARVGNPTVGVTLSVKNLSDSLGNRFALGTPLATGRSQTTPLRPRTFRLGVDFSF